VRGEAEVVVRAEVEDLPASHADPRALGAVEDALVLEQARLAERAELGVEEGLEQSVGHGGILRNPKTQIPIPRGDAFGIWDLGFGISAERPA
jgi:hypothetical protein